MDSDIVRSASAASLETVRQVVTWSRNGSAGGGGQKLPKHDNKTEEEEAEAEELRKIVDEEAGTTLDFTV